MRTKVLRLAMRWCSRLSNQGNAAVSARLARIARRLLSETLQDSASRAVVHFRVLGAFVYHQAEDNIHLSRSNRNMLSNRHEQSIRNERAFRRRAMLGYRVAKCSQKVKAHENVPNEQRVKRAATRGATTHTLFTDNFDPRRPLGVGKGLI